MNEVGFRFHELSLGQVKALDCGNSLGPILAKNSRKTGEKSRFFPWAGVENPWRGSKISIQTAGSLMLLLPTTLQSKAPTPRKLFSTSSYPDCSACLLLLIRKPANRTANRKPNRFGTGTSGTGGKNRARRNRNRPKISIP